MSSLPQALPLQWVYPNNDQEWVSTIIKEFMVHPIIASVLAARGFRDLDQIHSYLYSQLPDLYPPQRFTEMKRATERVARAIVNKEPILIYGDNDVDGITSTALLIEYIRKAGGEAHFFIPNRSNLNHHLLLDALDLIQREKISLVITVDCGITASSEVKTLTAKGVDVIITDHHVPTAKIPHSYATLNPKLLKAKYPNRELTGVGVAFKLACALSHHLISSGNIKAQQIDLKDSLDLVALGTIADMGSLLGENRILVRYGLKQMSSTKRIGLKQLLSVCGIPKGPISSNDIVLKVAPRINSLGRIANPLKGVELLLAKDPITAQELACELDLHNKTRQRLEQEMVQHLDEILEKQPHHLEHKSIVIASPAWHTGIVPLLTTRLNRTYHRPSVVIAIENGIGKGSIRSTRAFPLLDTLNSLQHLFLSYGGHDFAAGIMIEEKNIAEFASAFIKITNASLTIDDVTPKLQLDASLAFDEIDFDLIESLELLEPYGQENPPPLFYTKARQVWQHKIFKKNHIKLFLEQNDRILECVGFHLASRSQFLLGQNEMLSVAFSPQIFNSMKQSRVQLHLKDLITS